MNNNNNINTAKALHQTRTTVTNRKKCKCLQNSHKPPSLQPRSHSYPKYEDDTQFSTFPPEGFSSSTVVQLSMEITATFNNKEHTMNITKTKSVTINGPGNKLRNKNKSLHFTTSYYFSGSHEPSIFTWHMLPQSRKLVDDMICHATNL